METEFSVALPPALSLIERAMESVANRLSAGQAGESVVVAERKIEADLESLISAMQQMPNSRPQPPREPGNPSPAESERELNRIIAELNLIRMMQLRVNDHTKDADDETSGSAIELLTAELRTQIMATSQLQKEVLADLTLIFLSRINTGSCTVEIIPS